MPYSFCDFVAICTFLHLRFHDLQIDKLNKQAMPRNTAYQNGDVANITIHAMTGSFIGISLYIEIQMQVREKQGKTRTSDNKTLNKTNNFHLNLTCPIKDPSCSTCVQFVCICIPR